MKLSSQFSIEIPMLKYQIINFTVNGKVKMLKFFGENPFYYFTIPTKIYIHQKLTKNFHINAQFIIIILILHDSGF